MTLYDPLTYWDEAEAMRWPDHDYQEQVILETLANIGPTSLLDVGCGEGRIGQLLIDRMPGLAYTGIDLSERRLQVARRSMPTAELVHSTLHGHRPSRRWDVVLSVEVLMHIQPPYLRSALRRMWELTRYVMVLVEWTDPLPRHHQAASHNFLHRYRPQLRMGKVEEIPVGRQTMYVVSR
jgi:trans-aconitate methyltransferase